MIGNPLYLDSKEKKDGLENEKSSGKYRVWEKETSCCAETSGELAGLRKKLALKAPQRGQLAKTPEILFSPNIKNAISPSHGMEKVNSSFEGKRIPTTKKERRQKSLLGEGKGEHKWMSSLHVARQRRFNLLSLVTQRKGNRSREAYVRENGPNKSFLLKRFQLPGGKP